MFSIVRKSHPKLYPISARSVNGGPAPDIFVWGNQSWLVCLNLILHAVEEDT